MKDLFYLLMISLMFITSNQLYFELTEENERCYYEDLYYQNVSFNFFIFI
jgi:hypothetical protein